MMYDFCIVGGGIAGVSAAAKIAPHGTTLVLEAEDQLAYHASGRSAAMFLEDYGNDTVRALNRASTSEHHAAGILSPRDVMFVGPTNRPEHFQAEITEMGLTQITSTEALSFFPILNTATHGLAALEQGAMDLDTHKCLESYRKSARKAGATFQTKAPVTNIEKAGTGWQIMSSVQTWTAKTLINAAGAWADDVAAMAGLPQIGLQPYRRSFAQLPAPNGLNTQGWAFTHATENGWYAKPDAGKLLISPAEADPLPPHDAYADDMVIAQGLARFETAITTPVTRVETTWAGLRSFVADGALVLGRDPFDHSFIWCAAQGGYGFQTAAAASTLIGQIAAEQPCDLDVGTLNDLSPNRLQR